MGKVSALLELVVDLFSLACCVLDGFRTGAFRRRDQDIGQVVLFGHLHFAKVRGQEVFHFLVRDLNALGHAALTHTADDHFATNLLAGIFIGQTVVGQGLTELLDGHVVALGNGANGLVQLFIRDTDARAFADLQLQVFDDQALKHLLIQNAGRRYALAALGDGLLNFVDTLVQLALHDHVVVDDGHHFIQGLYCSAGCSTQEQRAQH